MTRAPRIAAVGVVIALLALALAPMALAKSYPLSRYELDQHVDAGLTNLSGTVDAIPHALAAIIWSLDRHAANWVIGLFDAAFNVDLTSPGSPLSGAAGTAAKQLYNQLARPLMATMVLIAGIWAMWQLLVLRNYAHGAGRLGVSLAYCILAMAIILAPASTIGTAAQASHQLAQASLSAVLPGSGQAATNKATEGLRKALIHEPWLVLDFGATAHCVNAQGNAVSPSATSSNGNIKPPTGGRCLQSRTLADRFLKHRPGSDERKDAFDELKDGSDLEKEAVSIQMGGAGYSRVALALGLLIAAIGAFILIGGLALGMIASQLYALLLCACAPVALLGALIPGTGHHLFEVWLKQLLGAIFRTAVYCLYLSVATALSLALAKAAPAIGHVGALTLQAILWWGLVIYGRKLSERLGERAIATPAGHAATDAAVRIKNALPLPTRSNAGVERAA